MAALPSNACGFKSYRSSAHHDHFLAGCGPGDHMRHGFFPAGGSVVDAESQTALVDVVEAVVGAHTRTNVIFALFDDLSDEVRVRHVGAGHADDVDLAGLDRITGGGDIRYPRCVKGREPGCGPDLSGKIEMRRTCHALDRDHVGQPG